MKTAPLFILLCVGKEGKMVCDSPLALIINHPFGTVDIDTKLIGCGLN